MGQKPIKWKRLNSSNVDAETCTHQTERARPLSGVVAEHADAIIPWVARPLEAHHPLPLRESGHRHHVGLRHSRTVTVAQSHPRWAEPNGPL